MLTDLIAIGLATWRISTMIVNERGPFRIFQQLREATGIEYDDSGNRTVWNADNPLTCVWCTSVYIAAALWLLPKVISYVFASSAIAILVNEHDVNFER